jgi:hypothetical protein
MKKQQIQIAFGVIVVAALIFQALCISASFNKNRELEASVRRLDTQQSQQLSQDSLSALNAIGMSQPAVSVTEKKIYFPELKLVLPLSDEATSLLYSSRQVGSGQTTYDITNRALASLPAAGYQVQFSCTPVRLSFEAKANPFNPNEKTNPAVSLADGRTLQIYTYANKACQPQWDAVKVDPAAIAQLFAKATSY